MDTTFGLQRPRSVLAICSDQKIEREKLRLDQICLLMDNQYRIYAKCCVTSHTVAKYHLSQGQGEEHLTGGHLTHSKFIHLGVITKYFILCLVHFAFRSIAFLSTHCTKLCKFYIHVGERNPPYFVLMGLSYPL